MHWISLGPGEWLAWQDVSVHDQAFERLLAFLSLSQPVVVACAHACLQPVATALFANSPFKEGKATGFKSWRSHVWTDTDPDR